MAQSQRHLRSVDEDFGELGCALYEDFGERGNQRYICRACGKTRVENYAYLAYKRDIDQNIIQLTKEGLGIRSTARILKISTTTLLKRIVSIARSISKPIISKGKTYEVDELCTYIRHKKNYIWLVLCIGQEF